MHNMIKKSFYEKTARNRISSIIDAGSFHEFLKAGTLPLSPNLQALDIPGSFDDGVIIGTARINKTPVHLIAQEGQFMGGAVGEIHGAKIVGLQLIQQQFDQWFGKKDGLEIWQGMHIQHAEHIPMLSAAAVIQIKQGVGYGN